MADQAIGSIHGVTSKSVNGGTNPTNINGGGANAPQATIFDGTLNLQSIATMRARLAVINGAYYTASMLNTMSYNDMMYAIRVSDFAGSI